MSGFCIDQGGEHLANAAEIHVRKPDAYEEGGEEHEKVLDYADPRNGADTADKHECSNKREGDEYGCCPADAAKARYLHNNPETGELELQIGNNENDANQRREGRQVLASVTLTEEVRLRLHAELLADFPDLRKKIEREHIG